MAVADADVVVMAAAVADFRPKPAAAGKLKKHDGPPEIVLEPTPDILAGLGPAKRPGRCSSASPPRPTTSSPTPRQAARASAST